MRRPSLTRRELLATSGALAAIAATGSPRMLRAQDPVTYWHHFTSQSEMQGLATVEAMFTAEGGTVQSEGIPNADYMSKVTTANVAGGLPDTLMISTERFADLAAQGAIVPLTDRLEGWPERETFTASAWEAISQDGEIYGVPAFSFVNWAYYRKDWFEEAGISPPDTFEEFREAAIKMTDPSKGRYGFGLRGGDGGQSFLVDVLDSYGALNYADGKATLDTEKARAAMAFYSGLATEHGAVPPSAPNDSYRQIMEGFKTGQTAMIWHHTGSLVELTDALTPDQIATSIRPAGPEGRIARVAYLYNGASGQGDPDASWAWIAEWAKPDAAIALLEATGYFPATSAVASDPRIVDNPIYAAALETLTFGVPNPNIVGFQGWLKDVALIELQKLLVETSTVEESVDVMARELDKAMR